MNKALYASIILFLLIITLPFLFATRSAGPDHVFGGFFLNPIDGNTYLAKMYQGWEGSWKFTLPYTAEPGEGAYLFLYYLFLGHLARLFGSSLTFTYHFARVMGAILLLAALYRFFSSLYIDRRTVLLAFILAAIGSGMGWLASLFRWVTADLWVAEGYPILSAYTNPHFPLAIAMMLWLLTPFGGKKETRSSILMSVLYLVFGFGLALLSPFAVILVAMVLAGQICWEQLPVKFSWFPKNPNEDDPTPRRYSQLSAIQRFAWVIVGGIPVMVYQLWISRSHPILSGWNAQNLTPTPSLWDIIVALSPSLILALVGLWYGIKRRYLADRLLIVWTSVSLVLIFIPFNLQLRFMIGIFIPIAGLAALGIEKLAGSNQRAYRNLTAGLFLLTLPTLLFTLLAALFSIQTHNPTMYLTKGEDQALNWIAQNTAPDALILAAPDTGLFIPAHSGRRVIYGHPFETVNAMTEKKAVTDFFAGSWTQAKTQEFLTERGIDFIFYGPRERDLGGISDLSGLKVVFEGNGVTVYAVEN